MAFFDFRSVHYDREVFHIDRDILVEYLRTLKPEQRFVVGLGLGVVATVAAAAGAFALITLAFTYVLSTHIEHIYLRGAVLGLCYCGVGFVAGAMVGLTIRHAGRGINPLFGLVGAVLGPVACAAAVVGVAAHMWGVPASEVLEPRAFLTLLIGGGSIPYVSLLSCLVACFTGCRLAFRRLTDSEVIQLQSGYLPEAPSYAVEGNR